jgi:hypothetical protein
MKLNDIISFFEHVSKREEVHGIENGFRFKSILTSRKKGLLQPAKYRTESGGSDEEEDSRSPLRNIRRPTQRTIRPEGMGVSTGLLTPASSQATTGLRTPADSPGPTQPRPLDSSSDTINSTSSRLAIPGHDSTPSQSEVIARQYETRSRTRPA